MHNKKMPHSWKLEVGGKVFLNGKPHPVLEKETYRTAEEYDDNKDYGGGIGFHLKGGYILEYTARRKKWNLVHVTEKKGWFYKTTTHNPIKIKKITFLKNNCLAVSLGDYLPNPLKEVLKLLTASLLGKDYTKKKQNNSPLIGKINNKIFK